MASEAEILQALNLGSSRAVLDNRGSSPLSQLLVDISNEIVTDLKQAIADRNINTASQGLSQSIQVKALNFDGNKLTVETEAEFYWKFVNYGVNGTEIHRGAPNWGPTPQGDLSFAESIRRWIPQRGLQLPPEFSSFESFTYAIMTNIRKHGQAARPFFEDVVNESLVAKIRKPIEAVIGRAVEISIVAPWQ